MNSNIDNLNLSELKELLKELKLYNRLGRQLGNRGKLLYNRLKSGESGYEVEYFPAMEENTAWEEAEKAFNKVFNLTPSKSQVKFTPKESLSGGIRIYVDDNVLDLSFDRIGKKLRK